MRRSWAINLAIVWIAATASLSAQQRVTRVSGPITQKLLTELAETADAALTAKGKTLCLSVQQRPSDHVLKTCRLNGWFYQHVPLGSCIERSGRQYSYLHTGNYLYKSDGKSWQPAGQLVNPVTVLRERAGPNYSLGSNHAQRTPLKGISDCPE